jgi:FSR family fosmidomycin resistance protein-like MFS transporter
MSLSLALMPHSRRTDRRLPDSLQTMASTINFEHVSAVPTMRLPVLGALSAAHLLNDMMQSLLLALYPIIRGDFGLSFTQLGLISLTYQAAASILQPAVGIITDRHPRPFAAALGMGFTMTGLFVLAAAHAYEFLLIAAALIGVGSAVFHPEASRMARLASAGRHGLGQSIFQIGGNIGGAIGPLLAVAVLLPFGRASVAWFGVTAIMAFGLLWWVGAWYQRQHRVALGRQRQTTGARNQLPNNTAVRGIGLLLLLLFSKYFYLESLDSYYMFYLISRFHVTGQQAQVCLFAFFAAVAVGTIVGGLIGDRVGRRRRVILWSILGAAPFTLALPHADFQWTVILVVLIGLIIASAFSAIVVFAQELMPNRIGMVSGLFFGLAFGFGGIGAAILGAMADRLGIQSVFNLCAYLPLLGAVALLLPDATGSRSEAAAH